ncbi:MAG TPA: glycosyltransferase family 4 protein [bacterium]|nr:glycosyltransferase family 4 protein [bacterium]
MRLLATTHVPHWQAGNRVMSSGYFVRDLRIFGDFFDEVHICAPVSKEPPPDDITAYSVGYSLTDCPVVRGSDLWSRLRRVWGMPGNVLRILRAMRGCDAIHIRGPENMGIFGAIALWFTKKPRCAKYAGQWEGYEGEPVANRIQRWLLSRRGFGGPVTVNAAWEGNRGHIYSVFNSSINRSDLDRTAEIAASKRLSSPMRYLFVGRLSDMKALNVLMQALARIDLSPRPALFIVGDGPLRQETERLVSELRLDSQVVFHGWLPPAELRKHYEQSHVLVLPSLYGEGWPKVINEAMLYGLPCISTSISSIPKILGDNERGLLVKPRDVDALTDAMTRLASDEELYARLSRAGRKWVENKTREDLMIWIKKILEESWGLELKKLDWM